MAKGMQQKMGYDRSITMFSPDGRLLQVEYAKKTVKQGSTSIGIATDDAVVLVADKRIVDELIVPESVEKMFKVDDHVGAIASGILSDARTLIEKARVKAQQHSVTYDTKIDTLNVVKELSDIYQVSTQRGGLRPFGVSLLVGGVDKNEKPKLYRINPTGVFFQYKAAAIGEGDEEIEEKLEEEYEEDMTSEEALKLAIDALSDYVGEDLNKQRIDAVKIDNEEREYNKVEDKKIGKVLKEVT